MSNLESEYLEEENGQPAKPSNKTASTTVEKKNAIETASNKRMRLANINPWTLRYNDESMESKVNNQLHQLYTKNIPELIKRNIIQAVFQTKLLF